MEEPSVPEIVLHGLVSPYAHGEVLSHPVLHQNETLFATLNQAFRKTLVLAADQELTTAMRESRHEDCTPEETDYICREREKYKLLAKH